MTISTTFPSDNYVPGVGGEFDFVTGVGVRPTSDRRMLIVGSLRSTGTATAERLYAVEDELAADTLFGIGSEVAIGVRAALATCRSLNLSPPEIYGIAVTEPGAGVAASGTFTVTGPATASGEVLVRIAGRLVRCAVASGDAQNTIAANLEAAVDAAERALPVGASVATNVVTVTYRTKGTNGNDVKIEVVNGKDGYPALPAGVAVAVSGANLASGAGVIDITASLDKAKNLDFWTIAISNNESTDVTDLDAHLDEMWATMTDRYRFAFMAGISALATDQTIAAAANDHRIVKLSCAGARSLPIEFAAAAAALAVGREKPNANHCGTPLPLFGPDLDSAYSPTEQNTAIKSGLSPLVPTPNGFVKLVRLVTTKTTENSVTYRALMDFGVPFAMARIAREIDDAVTLTLTGGVDDPEGGRNIDDNLAADLKSVALSILRIREADGWVQNVEARKDEIRFERHATNATRVILEVPEDIVPIAAQAIVKNRLLAP
jgi:phage tail sheath gpL-like